MYKRQTPCYASHHMMLALLCVFKTMYLDRQRYTVFWPYTICRPNTKTKISRTRGHTTHRHTRTDFFFGMYQLETRFARINRNMDDIVHVRIYMHVCGLFFPGPFFWKLAGGTARYAKCLVLYLVHQICQSMHTCMYSSECVWYHLSVTIEQ